jgi:hypothetical protein
MGRIDKTKKAPKNNNNKTPAKKTERRYSLIHAEGRRVAKARVNITSTEKGADALNVEYMEGVRDRLQIMILARLNASGRVKMTTNDMWTAARDLRGMPSFV